jgi:hypothetical protein
MTGSVIFLARACHLHVAFEWVDLWWLFLVPSLEENECTTHPSSSLGPTLRLEKEPSGTFRIAFGFSAVGAGACRSSAFSAGGAGAWTGEADAEVEVVEVDEVEVAVEVEVDLVLVVVLWEGRDCVESDAPPCSEFPAQLLWRLGCWHVWDEIPGD